MLTKYFSNFILINFVNENQWRDYAIANINYGDDSRL
jgi:hypothetical protein